MSIEASYRRITPDEFSRVQCDPKAAESFFATGLEDLDDPEKLLARMQERESSDCYLSIGTDWHALHFLLTGDGELRPHPLPPPPRTKRPSDRKPTGWLRNKDGSRRSPHHYAAP